MDPVFVNNTWRTTQGFFLTSGRDSTGEIAVFNKTTELLMAAFKDKQLRSSNLVDPDSTNLALLEDIVNQTLEVVGPLAAEQGVSSNGLVARTWFTAAACLGAYHEKIKRIQGRESDGRDGRDGRRPEAREDYNRPERLERGRPEIRYAYEQEYAPEGYGHAYQVVPGYGPAGPGGGHGGPPGGPGGGYGPAGGGYGGGGRGRGGMRGRGRGRFDESRSR